MLSLLKVLLFSVLSIQFVLSIQKVAAQERSFVVLDEATLDMNDKQKRILESVKALPGTQTYKLVAPAEKAFAGSTIKLDLKQIFGGTKPPSLSFAMVGTGSKGVLTTQGAASFPHVSSAAEANFTVRNGEVTGSVVDENVAYVMRPLGGGLHVVLKKNLEALPPDHPTGSETPASPRAPVDDFNSKNDIGDAVVIIPIVVGYHANVAKVTAAPDDLIENAIEITNQAFKNSQIKAVLSLRGTVAINSFETLDVVRAVNLLVKQDPGMKPLLDLKASTRSSIAMIIVNEGWACGKAAVILSNPGNSFAAVRQDCAVEKRSFPHELGHLLGVRHELASDPALDPYVFGHGYQSSTKHWRDIMAGDCGDRCGRRLIWSSPEIVIDGERAGSEQYEDAARVLRQTAPYVASWSSSAIPYLP
jgi:hypothetical protein